MRVPSFSFLPIIIWAATVCFGFAALLAYASSPGQLAVTAGHWPQESQLLLSNQQPTLLVFVHPACPCTRATLENLQKSLTTQTVKLQVVCLTPPDHYDRSELACNAALQSLKQQLDAEHLFDDGTEIANFAAATSGQCLLYSPSGTLIFSGGVTSSRGHLGGNAGLSTLLRQIHSPESDAEVFPVFGCSIQSQTTNMQQRKRVPQ